MNLFSKKALVLSFGVGGLTFVLGLFLGAFSGDLFGRRSSNPDGYSYSLLGHHALIELLRQSDLAVVVSRDTSRIQLKPQFPLLLLEPNLHAMNYEDSTIDSQKVGPSPDRTSLGSLKTTLSKVRAQNIPVVLALPKWIGQESQEKPGWISEKKLIPLDSLQSMLEVLFDLQESDAGGSNSSKLLVRSERSTTWNAQMLLQAKPDIRLGSDVQLILPYADLTPLVSSKQGILIGKLDTGDQAPLVLISDPDLFNNQGLSHGDHAALFYSLLKNILQAEGIVVDEAIHGFRHHESLLAWFFGFPINLIVLHLVMSLGLLFWALGRRFGKPLQAPPALAPGKKLLITNTARLLLVAGESVEAARGYMEAIQLRVARSFSIPDSLTSRERLRRLDQLGQDRRNRYELKHIVQASRKRSLSPTEALRLAQDIYQWQENLLGPSRPQPDR